MLRLYFFCFIIFQVALSPTIVPTTLTTQGIISGSTFTVTNSTITVFDNRITFSYLYTFLNTPLVTIALADYMDQSTQQLILFGIFVQSVTTTQMVYSFFYTTQIALFPVSFRMRYLIWDPVFFSTMWMQRYAITFTANQTHLEQNYTLTTPVDASMSQSQSYIQIVYNFKVSTVGSLGIVCISSLLDNNTLKMIFGLVPCDQYFLWTSKALWFNVVIVQDTATVDVQCGSFYSTMQNIGFVTLSVPLKDRAYLIGLYGVSSNTRSFSVGLSNDYAIINSALNYVSVFYNYMLIRFNVGSAYIYKMETAIDTNILTLHYKNVFNPASVSPGLFVITGAASMILQQVDHVQLQTSPSQGDIFVKISYTKDDIILVPQVVFRSVYGGLLTYASTYIYMTTLRYLGIDFDSNTSVLTFYNVVGTTDVSSYKANFSFYNNLLHNLIVPGTSFLNVSLKQNAYDSRISVNITYGSEDYSANMSFRLIKVQSIQAIITTNQSRVKLSGMLNPSSVLASYFLLNSSVPISLDTIETNDENVTLVFSNGIQNLLTLFDIKCTFPKTNNIIYLSNIHMDIVEIISLLETQNRNEINITLRNPFNISILQTQFQILEPSFISITSMNATDNIIQIIVSFSQDLNNQKVSLSYQPQNLVYSNILTFKLASQAPIYYWNDISIFSYPHQIKIDEAIQYIYLAVFAVSLLCNKMLGVQTIYLLQLTFYSLIPIGLQQSISLLHWESMKYVSGYNPLFNTYNQNIVSPNYSRLHIQSQFQSNFNLMFLFLLICPFVFLGVQIAARKTVHYKTKPQLIKYSRAFLLEFPLAFLLFNSFNVYTATVVSFQYDGRQDTFSLVFSIFMSLLSPAATILLTIFQKHFTQFNRQISEVDMIYKISIEKSTIIRKIYPLFICVEMTLVPVILALESYFKVSLYIVLGVVVIIGIYILIATPYVKKSDNLRLLINRILAIGIVSVQLYTHIQIQNGNLNSEFLSYQSWILYALLIIGVLMNSAFITLKTIEWFQKPGSIDMRLYVQQKGTAKKTDSIDFASFLDGTSYPKMEYGVGRKNLMERKFNKNLKKELLLSKNRVES